MVVKVETAEEKPGNEVRLVGRVSKVPEARQLPSGDTVVTFRVIVPRTARRGGRDPKGVDALECSAWSARARRTAVRLAPEDLVEVHGALRRRFFRSGAAVQSLVEVEVGSVRVIRRASSA